MNKQFINGVLETLRDDERQICKQAANIIGELAAEIEDKDDELDSLKRDIEKMKCCQNCDNSRYTEQGTTCKDDDLECEGLSHWVMRR